MIHLGNLEQLQLPTLLERIQHDQKTGKVLVIYDGVQEEIYVDQGQVVAVSSPDEKEPLLRRLARSGVVSLSILQHLPTNIGQILSQSQGHKRYSDVQIAKALLELGVVSHEQLAKWAKQESTKALQHLLSQPTGQVYFDEGVQLPAGHLYRFLETEAFLSPVMYNATPMNNNTVKEASEVPTTPLPSLFKQIKPAAEIEVSTPVTPLPIFLKNSQTTTRETLVPVAPSSFVRLPGTIGRTLAIPAAQATQVVIQRTASAIRPFLPIDDTLTERIPTPPKPNPLFKWETLLIIAVLLVAGLAHGINMFHFPYIENDEGTYMSQAWSVINEGKLAPYTYWYDHVPGGWLQIAVWVELTGGFHTFGSIINSGRVLMLLMQIGSTLMLYYIARNISQSITIATLVALLFALSPYGIYYHRRILLDNIMTFWMLLSILLLVSKSVSLKHIWLSAVSLGISILSKEVAVFIIPVMIYLVFLRSHRSHRWYAVIGWITIVVAIISLYVLYAILKNELFPSGTLLGGTNPHVSLIGTLQYQASRGKDGGFFDLHSGFWYMVSNYWISNDPMLVIVGSLCTVISIIAIRWNKLIGLMGLITLALWAFLARGGEILSFYLLPLLPCLALNIGLTLSLIVRLLKKYLATSKGRIMIIHTFQTFIAGICLMGIFVGYSSPDLGFQNNHFLLWNSSQADQQNDAIVWAEKHIPHNSVIVIDNFSWTDLRDTGTGTSFPNVQWYWKVDLDPAIRIGVFHNNWRNIDYLIVTDQMIHDAEVSQLTLVEDALQHSTTLVRFEGSWPIEIRRVDK